jgi:hypothetical protein
LFLSLFLSLAISLSLFLSNVLSLSTIDRELSINGFLSYRRRSLSFSFALSLLLTFRIDRIIAIATQRMPRATTSLPFTTFPRGPTRRCVFEFQGNSFPSLPLSLSPSFFPNSWYAGSTLCQRRHWAEWDGKERRKKGSVFYNRFQPH